LNTKSISTSTGIETAVPPLDTSAVTDYVNLGIHTLVACDSAYVVDVTVDTEALNQTVSLILQRKSITKVDSVNLQECTILQEVRAELLLLSDVLILCVSNLQEVDIVLLLQTEVHLASVVNVEVDPATDIHREVEVLPRELVVPRSHYLRNVVTYSTTVVSRRLLTLNSLPLAILSVALDKEVTCLLVNTYALTHKELTKYATLLQTVSVTGSTG
jgi:hypothetical protein